MFYNISDSYLFMSDQEDSVPTDSISAVEQSFQQQNKAYCNFQVAFTTVQTDSDQELN